MRDTQVACNEWPMALVSDVLKSPDGKVRKIEIKVSKDGSCKKYVRPISEVILLLSRKDQESYL